MNITMTKATSPEGQPGYECSIDGTPTGWAPTMAKAWELATGLQTVRLRVRL